MKRIAIIGSGISGLTAGYLLSKKHQITLFEAGDTLGGHTATVDITLDGRQYAVDTGFIVFNDRTYPNFLKLLAQIGLEKQPTEMSFSVQHGQSGLEYNGHSLRTLFAQKGNLLRPRFWYFLWEILRFNKLAKQTLATSEQPGETLGDFLYHHRFSDYFAEHYILPMVAAIWSSSLADSRAFPLAFFLRFFDHHGLLNISNRPQWYVLPGGSRSYIPHLTRPIQQIRLSTPVHQVTRTAHGVLITSSLRGADAQTEQFDEVILACHSDQALALLGDSSDSEQQILSRLQYRDNEVVLHHDRAMLPKARAAWASWNYFLPWPGPGQHGPQHSALPSVTYNMNILQGLVSDQPLCVTLNRSQQIAPDKILHRFVYAHPVYNQAAIDAQQRRSAICGVRHTHFCGAYWYNGFHEDGVNSALDVCRRFGLSLDGVPAQAVADTLGSPQGSGATS